MTRASPDLFGQIPVSHADIEVWLDRVPRLPPDSPRRSAYAAAWNVPEKIRAAKQAGDWPPPYPSYSGA